VNGGNENKPAMVVTDLFNRGADRHTILAISLSLLLPVGPPRSFTVSARFSRD
jgi:hypothetical protein